jgi:HEAT repeat protein
LARSAGGKSSHDTASLSAKALDDSADSGVRWLAVRELAKHNDSEAVEALSSLLSDGDMRIRQQAAQSLREIGPQADAAVPSLLIALFDGEGPVRVAAARALGTIGDKSAIPQLVKVAETTAWDTLHSWATESLVRLGSSEAAVHLVRRLESERAWQRRWAAGELGAIGTPDAIPAIRKARKRDFVHRRTYSRAIRQIEQRTSMRDSGAVG